ncbi:MAG: citrate/2-methylcitrate synthase [Dehalococcoidia bacterium]|nr:citrate/2-methylcitrate synthase [Dehalococcoidia bacterium]
MVTTGKIELHRGLSGVYLDRTESCFIDGAEGKLLYRGYNIHDLAEKSTFEEVMHLLLYKKLPNRKELAAFDAQLKADRAVPAEVLDIVDKVKKAHPMDVLRTAVSALAAFDPETTDNSIEATIRKGLRLTSQAPTIVAAHDRIRKGLKPIPPSRTLNHAGNFLHMLFGRNPTPEEAHIMDVDFILHAEHGANASAFAARVTASTVSDLHSAIVTGIGTLKGPAHGGAAEEVMKMAEEISTPEKAAEWARKRLDGGGRVMGFGHRVYKAEDPRAQHLRDRSKVLGEQKGEPQWFQLLANLQEVMKPYQRRGIFVNVDFYAGSVYYLMGVPEDIFVSIFALGRIPGWTLNVVEQFERNMLIRPLMEYTGPMDVPYVPLAQRP